MADAGEGGSGAETKRVDEWPVGRRSLKFIISLDPAIRHRSSVLPTKLHPFPKSRMRKWRLMALLRGFSHA